MSRPITEVVINVFNEWFLKKHGMLPDQAIERIAELESGEWERWLLDTSIEQAERAQRAEVENKRLKEQLAESEAELLSLLDSEGLLEKTDEKD